MTYEFERTEVLDTGLGGTVYGVSRDGVVLGTVRHIVPYERPPYWVATVPMLLPNRAGYGPGEFKSAEKAADALARRVDD